MKFSDFSLFTLIFTFTIPNTILDSNPPQTPPSDEIAKAWAALIKDIYPLTELTGAFDANYEKFQETAKYFSEYRKYKMMSLTSNSHPPRFSFK